MVGSRSGRALLAATGVMAWLAFAATASAQAPSISVEQGYGFATVKWSEVPGATEYEIERAPAGSADPGVVVGRWLPTRYRTGELTFADSGFVLGESYRWRVRALMDTMPGEWSAAAEQDTQDQIGPDRFLTGFETSGATAWTLHEDELELVKDIGRASRRVEVETIGHTLQGRPLQLATVSLDHRRHGKKGKPKVLIMCTVHGGERAPREACMITLRRLAFSHDAWVAKILSRSDVLIIPTVNPDGQAIAERTNSTGQDINRDHILIRHPESYSVAKVLRDERPNLVIDGHELGTGADLSLLWSRSPNVGEDLWDLAQNHMTWGWMFGAGADAGWSTAQYPTDRQDNWESMMQNTGGLKNVVAQLQESPQNSGPMRPNAPTGAPQTIRRRVYSHVWGFAEHLEYHHRNLRAIEDAIEEAEEDNEANRGPISLDGGRDVPVTPPSQYPITKVLDPAPCGYRLTPEQYLTRAGSEPGAEVQWQSETVAKRLAAHGIEVRSAGGIAVDVELGQRLRPLIPYVLDPDLESPGRPLGLPNISMVKAMRLDDRRATVTIGDEDSGVRNRLDRIGCSINDRIADEQPWTSRQAFLRHVDNVLDQARDKRLIDRRDADRIERAAERSGIGG
jgi:hypothetical protein